VTAVSQVGSYRGLTKNFWLYWSAVTTSATGTAISVVVTPLLAVITLGASPAEVAVLAGVGMVPPLLLQVVTGMWADSVTSRVQVLVVADVLRCLLTACVPALWLAGWLTFPLLVVVSAARAVVGVFHSAFSPAVIVQIVPADALVSANGKLNGTRSATDVVGQGLGGVLASAFAPALAIIADSISFLVSAVLFGRIRVPDQPRPDSVQRRRSFSVRDVAGLAATLAGRPGLWVLVALAAAGGISETVFVIFCVRTLSLSPFAIGLLLATGAIGGVIGGFTTGWLSQRLGRWTGLFGLASTVWALVPLTVAEPGITGVLATINFEFAGALGGTVALANVFGQLQAGAEGGTIARVMALAGNALQIAALLGVTAGGLLGELLGPRGAFIVAVAVLALAFLPIAVKVAKRTL
jgi:predicted MFS family arabinose efflux permease